MHEITLEMCKICKPCCSCRLYRRIDVYSFVFSSIVVGIFVGIILKNAGPPMQNLEALRGTAELSLKVSLRMGSESVIGVSNSYDLAWIGQKSEHFRREV